MIVGLGLILDRSAPEEIVDAIWALASPEVFTMLTEGEPRKGTSVTIAR